MLGLPRLPDLEALGRPTARAVAARSATFSTSIPNGLVERTPLELATWAVLLQVMFRRGDDLGSPLLDRSRLTLSLAPSRQGRRRPRRRRGRRGSASEQCLLEMNPV